MASAPPQPAKFRCDQNPAVRLVQVELLAQRGFDLVGRIAADAFVDDLTLRIDEEQSRRAFDTTVLGDRVAVTNERECQVGDGAHFGVAA